jgi:hypothetical protein
MIATLMTAMLGIAAADETELKVAARGPWGASAAPGTRAVQLVIRSPEELAKVSKLTEEQLVRQFKVDSIDWKKQMVVVATAGAKGSGGFKFEITNLTVRGDTLTVKWKLTPPMGFATNAFTHPGQAVLVERYEGKVVFEPPLAKDAEPRPHDMEVAIEQLVRIERELLEEQRTLEVVKKSIIVQPLCGLLLGPNGAVEATEEQQAERRMAYRREHLPKQTWESLVAAVSGERKPEGQEMKILGHAFWREPTQRGAEAKQFVIRSPEELTKAGNLTEEQLVKQFKVDKIDWKTQMIVVVTGGVKPTGGYSVEVESLNAKEKVLTVKWKLNSPKRGTFVPQIVTHPGQAVLTERFEGEVKFDPPAPKGGAK